MVVISNGFNRFHLAVAAAEADRHQLLSLFLTGAYPTTGVKRAMKSIGIANHPKIGRLLGRGEKISERLVRSLWLSETVHQAAQQTLLWRARSSLGDHLDCGSLSLYGMFAARHLKSIASRAKIYHYRAGFGQASLKVARSAAMFNLCDHSLVHPEALVSLMISNGRLSGSRQLLTRFWSLVLKDIDSADAILVNSAYVKSTFVERGYRPDRIHVIYLGVDDSFLNQIPLQSEPRHGPLRLLFAGLFERRKGAHTLIDALDKLRDVDWRLEIAGRIDNEVRTDRPAFLENPRVSALGPLPRAHLAKVMANAELFVFPSLAEGSARVIFEAMAAGCFVITTENSGSIVEDGVHGRIVAAGDAAGLAEAIQVAAADRERLFTIGKANASLVRRCYTQMHYGDNLRDLYLRVVRSD